MWGVGIGLRWWNQFDRMSSQEEVRSPELGTLGRSSVVSPPSRSWCLLVYLGKELSSRDVLQLRRIMTVLSYGREIGPKGPTSGSPRGGRMEWYNRREVRVTSGQ